MKTDRLIGIVMHLMDNGRTPAGQLAEKFEVSPRTIMRDMESLDMAGIPIVSLSGKNGGYAIEEGFILNSRIATRDDMGWIITALKGLADARISPAAEHALDRLSGINAKLPPVDIDLSAAGEQRGITQLLQLIEGAIASGQMIGFNYTNSRNEQKAVVIEPKQLAYRWYNWYLIGTTEEHGEDKMYKLVRMDDVQLTDESLPGHAGAKSLACPVDSIHVRLYGRADARYLCREYLNGQFTAEYENGDFEFCFSAPAHEFFWFGALLSMGNRVKVLEPASLVARITDTCREVLDEYDE